MSDVSAALRAYVATDEPPIGLRGPEVVAAGRRARRNRRLATAGVAVFVVVAVAAGLAAVPGLRDHDQRAGRGDGFAALPACPRRPGARPATPVEPDRPIPADVLAWALPTVTCYLADRVPRLLPAARFAPAPVLPTSPRPLEAFPVGDDRIDAVALVRDDVGAGDLHVLVRRAAPDLLTERRDACAAQPGCTETTTDGATVFTRAYPRSSGNGTAANQAEVVRGRTHIVVVATDSDESMLVKDPVATRPTPVPTVGQLAELALGPELALFP